jgi:hypothetical protein
MATRWVVGLLFALAVVMRAAAVEAAGPWRATIVDAETRQPLEGVVVLALFTKCTAGWSGDYSCEYVDAEEAATGRDGRFEISPHPLPSSWRTEIRSEFLIFMPGYGRARPANRPRRVDPDPDQSPTWSEILQAKDALLEMPPLKTWAARRDYYNFPGHTVAGRVPRDRWRRYREAENVERQYLGLSPLQP